MVIIIIAHQTGEILSNSADKLLEVKYSLNNFPAVIVVLLVFAASPFSKSEVNSSPSTVANLEVAILYTTTSDERSQVVYLLLAGYSNIVIFGNPQSVKIA